jgi:hypothetical protein
MSTDETQTTAARMRELIAEVADSPVGDRLRDPDTRRRHAYDALLHNPDPVLREIGEQLCDGRMRPSDILRVPAYAEAFRHAARSAQERLHPREIVKELEELVAKSRDDRRAQDTPPATHGRPQR